MEENKYELQAGITFIMVIFVITIIMSLLIIFSNFSIEDTAQMQRITPKIQKTDQTNKNAQKGNHSIKGNLCGHGNEDSRSTSKIVNDRCLFKARYGGERVYSIKFPKELRFETVGANVDNIIIYQDDAELFVGVTAKSPGGETIDDIFWTWDPTPEPDEYIISREKKPESREILLLGDNSVTKLKYDTSVKYVLFDMPGNKERYVFEATTGSTNPLLQKQIESILGTMSFK